MRTGCASTPRDGAPERPKPGEPSGERQHHVLGEVRAHQDATTVGESILTHNAPSRSVASTELSVTQRVYPERPDKRRPEFEDSFVPRIASLGRRRTAGTAAHARSRTRRAAVDASC